VTAAPAAYTVDQLGRFVVDSARSDLSDHALETLKRNVLDSIACAIGALDGELIPAIRAHAEQFSGRPTTTFVGGGRASVDQSAFFNAVLVRYPDLLDTYLTPGGLCHPADNFGAVLAVAEHADASGAEFLLALAVAYEIQCRFSAQVPVMGRGLNHALQLAMSAAAGSAKLLGLDASQSADAIAASAVDNVSLAAVHTEPVSTWKGISPAITGMRAVYATVLAGRGITGPRGLFEGPNGLEQLFDQRIDLRTSDRALIAVEQTYLKQYCALIHGQVVIDATLALRDEHGITGADVATVTLEVFQGAFDIAGGGRYGNKDHPSTKEQADYNLKYLVAAALLDRAADDLTEAYPARTQARVRITVKDGREFHREQSDFEGSPTRPMSWDRVVEKFHWLAEPFAGDALRAQIIDAVHWLDEISVAELTALLGAVGPSVQRPRTRGRL